MPQSVLEMAKDLVEAQIQAGQLTPDEMPQALQSIYASLMALETSGGGVSAGVLPVPRSPSGTIDWRKSITRSAITCLECGSSMRQLSRRHLRQHDLDPRSYRAKYDIPRTLPLASKDTTARRRQAAQEIRPWEKTPRYLATQKAKAAAAKKGSRKKAARAKG